MVYTLCREESIVVVVSMSDTLGAVDGHNPPVVVYAGSCSCCMPNNKVSQLQHAVGAKCRSRCMHPTRTNILHVLTLTVLKFISRSVQIIYLRTCMLVSTVFSFGLIFRNSTIVSVPRCSADTLAETMK